MSRSGTSVVVLAYNGRSYLEPCLDAVLSQSRIDTEVIVVDNASTDGSADFVAERFPSVHLIRNEQNLGFAGGNNVGLRAATGSIVVVLNQDTVVQPGWLAALMKAFEDPAIGLAGCKILYPDGQTIQHAGAHLKLPTAEGQHDGQGEIDRGQYDEPREVEYVSGAALAIRRQVIREVGLFDVQFFPGYYEDVDLCLRARQAGFRVIYWPAAVVHHCEAGSFDRESYSKHHINFRNRIRFLFKHVPPDQVLDQFIPAIGDSLSNMGLVETRAVALGCLDAMLIWPKVAPGGVDRDVSLRVVHAFRGLHDRAVAHELGLVDGSP